MPQANLWGTARDKRAVPSRAHCHLRAAPRRVFEQIRDAPVAELNHDDDLLIHQFLNGATTGPLTDEEGLSEFERQLMIAGEA